MVPLYCLVIFLTHKLTLEYIHWQENSPELVSRVTENSDQAKNRIRHRTRKIKYNYLSPPKFPYLQKKTISKNVYRTREIITT